MDDPLPTPLPLGDGAAVPAPGSRVALVVNPSAGAGRGRDVGRAVAAQLRALGHHVDDLTADDARAAARAAEAAVAVARAGGGHETGPGVDALVVVGGDGMVHLGINAVAGSDLPLGVVPAGTGNDIARAWGLPADPVAATDTLDACLRSAMVRRVDAVRVEPVRAAAPSGPPPSVGETTWVGGVTAAGFDAVVNERANGWRWPRGAARYNLAIARELPLFRPVPYRLVLDGEEWRTEGLLVAVANTASYGGGMRIAPDARCDDGLLDVVVVTPVSLPRFVRLFPRVYEGTHVEVDAVQVRRARTVEVHVDPAGRYPRRIVAYGDGERLGELPRRFTAVPDAVSVLAPDAT